MMICRVQKKGFPQMDNKIVCPKCGQIYDAEFAKCPLCGAAAPKSAAPVQPAPARESEKGGKYLSAEDKKEMKREEEEFLREEEGRYRRLKRRGESDAPQEEPDPHIPAGFLVASVLILFAALVLGGSFLLWKTGLVKISLFDWVASKPSESIAIDVPDPVKPSVSSDDTSVSDSVPQTQTPTDTVPTEPALPAYDPALIILVNDENPIPSDYDVGELVTLRKGAKVSDRCIDDLSAMMEACRAAQHYPDVYTGYDEFAHDLSEYRTGLAVDILLDDDSTRDVAKMSDSDTLKWLWEHCWEYGFIVRYPEGKESITGHSFEPWHFRYVGKDAAAYMHENDLCLEELHAMIG